MSHSRRDFLGGAVAAGGSAFLAGDAVAAGPAGLLEARIALAHRRLTGPGFPAFTPEFVLADVTLDPKYPRLYSEFSGNLSGRYLEALALHSPAAAAQAAPLLTRLLAEQRPDGRFGNASLSFTDPSRLGKPHMALLWGNGRLLVGLLACRSVRPGDQLLAAARRLGDFLLSVRAQCSRPEVLERMKVMAAHGIICFTQLVEGLAMLFQATGDRRYAEAGREIALLLPPRGVQHTHGYLTTLRGILMLHEAANDPGLLAFVEDRYADLVASPDYLTVGGVMELFGAASPGLSAEDFKKEPQDEGCSEADFVRLALQLWRVTKKLNYLEAAERCLHNQFFANQFHTGDFGHHPVFRYGFRASPQVGIAWWCCSMHGLRALLDVRRALASRRPGVVGVDLFLDGRWSDGDMTLAMQPMAGDRFKVTVQAAPTESTTISIRHPSWASRTRVTFLRRNRPPWTLAGKPDPEAARTNIGQPWLAGDVIEVAFDLRARIETRDRRVIEPEKLGTKPEEGALFYGPWLLGVHEAEEPLFFRRPWAFGQPNNDNVLRLPADPASLRVPVRPFSTRDVVPPPPLQCRVGYMHGGWPQAGQVTLRPIAAQTAVVGQQTLAIRMPFARA